MTELEHQLIRQLISAALPFPLQIAVALGLVVGYLSWSGLYFRVLDRRVRTHIGRALGVRVRWVRRGSASYQTPYELDSQRHFRWSWGIEDERQRTLLRDGLVATLCFVVVNLVGGLLPVAIFFLVTLWFRALSAVLLIPAIAAVLAIYTVFWSGRYEVTGMLLDPAEPTPPRH